MPIWTAERITADAAQKMQIGAGLLLNSFDITNPVEPANSEIICDTTGDFTITCTPETSDIFEDVNNAPTNTKEGKRIDGWTCGLSVESLTFTPAALRFALGAADISGNGVSPRKQYKLADFASLYWVGDMLGDEDKLFVVVMDNAVSTGGISITTTNKGKGRMALDITPHVSTANQDKMPMDFYVLTKTSAAGSTDLATFDIDGADFDEPFNPSVTRYFGDASSISVTVSATAKDSAATVVIKSDGTTIDSGDTVTLDNGANLFTVTVTNNTKSKTYTAVIIYNS